jgi:hypothetical protein
MTIDFFVGCFLLCGAVLEVRRKEVREEEREPTPFELTVKAMPCVLQANSSGKQAVYYNYYYYFCFNQIKKFVIHTHDCILLLFVYIII